MPRAYDEYDVSDCLKQSGWVLPAYTMAPNAKHVTLLRAVIRCGYRLQGCALCCLTAVAKGIRGRGRVCVRCKTRGCMLSL